MINRSAITVRVKQPFVEWLHNLPDPVETDTTPDEINFEPNAYLLPEYEKMNEKENILDQFYDLVFELELFGWWTDQNDWPTDRTREKFDQWFDVEFHPIIVDLFDEPLIDED